MIATEHNTRRVYDDAVHGRSANPEDYAVQREMPPNKAFSFIDADVVAVTAQMHGRIVSMTPIVNDSSAECEDCKCQAKWVVAEVERDRNANVVSQWNWCGRCCIGA